MIRAKMRFRPYSPGGYAGTWSYTVSADVRGESAVVLCDNTGGSRSSVPGNLFRQAARDAVVADRVYWSGHSFSHSYAELVDMVDD